MTDRETALETLRVAQLNYTVTAANWGVNLDIKEIAKQNLMVSRQILEHHEKHTSILQEILDELRKG